MEDAATDEDVPASSTRTSQTPVPRACDACRARKIRCNRELPCAHCVHAKIECTQAGAKLREKRTRILLTHQYEKKIDHIDQRLDGVLQLLEELTTRLPSLSTVPVPVPATAGAASRLASPTPASHASCDIGTGTTESVVEGDSSLTAHSAFASDLLEKVVSKDSRPEMRERIEALRGMVEAMKKQPAAHEMTYPHAKPVRPAALEGCDLPPIDKTLEVLKLAKSHKQLGLTWIFDAFDMDRFPETCLGVYMADDRNMAHFITVNALLHHLFWTYGNIFSDRQAEYLALSRLCGVNIETALASLPLHLAANDDVVVALLLGAFYAIELAKPSLAWILSSKASELCQSLGYHRAGTFMRETPDAAQHKQFLFWVTFIVDKSLSLRLGRSSTIQGYDVTIPEPSSDVSTSRDPMNTAFFALWVVGARLHGQIYELLYCPEAIAQPEGVRRSRVDLLLCRLGELETLTDTEAQKWDSYSRETAGPDITDFFILSDLVLRLSTRTLIHRAVPNAPGSPTTFSTACVQAARETLSRHQQCMAVVERTKAGLFSVYMSWTILFAPFVPFIVLFCQVIETRDRTDLARLQAFVASLQPHPAANEGVEKLRRLSQVLYSVASQYVESHEGYAKHDRRPSMEVDTCLAALGFPPPSAPSLQEGGDVALSGAGNFNEQAFQRGVNPMIWMGNETQLEDWFYNNQQMMTFMEDGFPGDTGWGGNLN